MRPCTFSFKKVARINYQYVQHKFKLNENETKRMKKACVRTLNWEFFYLADFVIFNLDF